MEMYLVGGIVRDMLLGMPAKDHDFSVVLEETDFKSGYEYGEDNNPFAVMRTNLEDRGVEIFVETPEFLTIRGRFSKVDPDYPGIAADFVLARKDSRTSDGRRPEYVVPGTLEDDLARRDFTVNAMAMSKDGSIIDLFNGQEDLESKLLRFVGDPVERIQEDALRVMRALRFCVTKGFKMTPFTQLVIYNKMTPPLLAKISEERRADELSKMFRFDTEATLDCLAEIPKPLRAAMFAGRVRLDSTLKK